MMTHLEKSSRDGWVLHKSDRIYTLGNATNIWFGENSRKSSHIITDVIESWVAKLVAPMLVPAALRVRIQTSLKNHKWATKANERPTHSSQQKKILKNYGICFLSTWYLFYVVDISTRQHSEVAVGGGGGEGRRGSVEQACLLILSVVIRDASDWCLSAL